MALSGNIGGTLVARDIARKAVILIGGPLDNGEVSAEDGRNILMSLNLMMKSWQADGCNLWRLSDETVTIPANTKTVQLDPRVMDVMEARYDGSVTFQRLLARVEWGDYRSLPNKNAEGLPTQFTLNKQRTFIEMSVWPVPTEDITISYSGARVIEDVIDLNNEVDAPQEWLETVIVCLAERIIPDFGADALNANSCARVTARAKHLYDKLLDFDRTGSVFMKPWGAPAFQSGY